MRRIERWATQQRLARPEAERIVVVPHDMTIPEPMMASIPEQQGE